MGHACERASQKSHIYEPTSQDHPFSRHITPGHVGDEPGTDPLRPGTDSVDESLRSHTWGVGALLSS